MNKISEEVFFAGLQGLTKKAKEAPPVPLEAEVVAPPVVQRPLSSKSLFSHPEAHPIALDLALLKHFHLEWFSWLPETLFSEIEKTFGGSIAEVNRVKIMAVQTLHVTDVFWDHWEIFEKTLSALNGIPTLFDVVQPPDLGMLLSGVEMANAIRKEEFGEEVCRYVAAVFLYENVHYTTETLAFAQNYISQPTYLCQDCDKLGSALPPFDGICTSCGGYFTSDTPFNFKPDPEAVKRGAGRNLKYGLTYDPAPVKARLGELEGLSADKLSIAIKETPEDIQAAKLIAAIDFAAFRAGQLTEQLDSLKGWLEMI